jgi:hypothetical protein
MLAASIPPTENAMKRVTALVGMIALACGILVLSFKSTAVAEPGETKRDEPHQVESPGAGDPNTNPGRWMAHNMMGTFVLEGKTGTASYIWFDGRVNVDKLRYVKNYRIKGTKHIGWYYESDTGSGFGLVVCYTPVLGTIVIDEDAKITKNLYPLYYTLDGEEFYRWTTVTGTWGSEYKATGPLGKKAKKK